MASSPPPSTPASAPRALLLATFATAALLLLWSPATSFAHAGGAQVEHGRSLKTALVSAGLLRRGAGYGVDDGSAAVRRLQIRLRRLGFRPGPIDGLFGPLTQQAVERFQVASGLTTDGVVGRATRAHLLRPVPRTVGSSRHDRPARHRSAPKPQTTDRQPAVEAAPPRDVAPDTGGARRVPAEPQRSDGLAPEVAAGLGALAMAVLLGGAWLLGGRRRSGTPAGDGAGRERSAAANLRFGMVCASLLAVFAVGAAAGALFATQASPDQRRTEKTHGTAATTDVNRAAGAEAAVQRRPHRSPSTP